ncbi:MAG: Gfo/Idh/MocA family oxidoreductase [Rhizobiaceae bacterium]
MFRWGILSTAKIGREHVIPGIVQSSNGVLAGIASREIAKAEALAKQFGALKAYGSYESMLADPEIDGIYIPLPTSQHVEWTIKCADAGKHVLCEKPISLNASEIDQLVAARERNKVIISEAFMVTYHPQWAKVRDLIANGAIGTLRHVQGAFTYFNTDPTNMRNIVELGGGALPDIGVYPTVTTRFATGKEPQKVSAKVVFDPVFKTDTFSSVRADFGDFELSFYLSTQMANRQLMVFHGDAGFIEVHAPFNASLYDHDHITLHNRSHDGAQVFRFPGIHQYALEAEAFVRAAEGGKQKLFTLEESISNQKLIDAIFKAGKTGNWENV